MAIPKLFYAAYTLSKDEWSSFRKYLLMSAKKDSDNVRLFEAMKKSRTNLIENDFSDKIRTKHFSEMSPKNYSNLLSRVFIVFEEWFGTELLKSEAYTKSLLLNKGYNRKGLFKLANQKFDQLEKVIHDNKVIDVQQQRVLYELYNQTYHSTNPKRKEKDLFRKIAEALVSSSREQALLWQLDAANRTRLFIVDEDSSTVNSYLESIAKLGGDNELSRLLKEALKLFQADEIGVLKFRDLLEESSLSRSSDLYLILASYFRINTIRLYKAGTLSDGTLVSEAYRINLMAFDLNQNHKLTQVAMVNAVDWICTFESFEDSEKIIDEWIPKTTTNDPESLRKYCQCLNYFKHERYEELPRILAEITYERVDIRLNGQAMLLIALYMIGEEELLLTKIDNLKKQLKRGENKFPTAVAIGIKNLMSLLKVLLLSKYTNKVSINLSDYTPIIWRSWVVNHIQTKTELSVSL